MGRIGAKTCLENAKIGENLNFLQADNFQFFLKTMRMGVPQKSNFSRKS